MRSGFLRFIVRRVAAAAALIVVVASAALLLARIAPGRDGPAFEVDPVAAALECERIRCQDPLVVQYAVWFARAIRLDLGLSARYRRPVGDLVAERARNSLVLGCYALLLATALGIPAGVLTGSRSGPAASALTAASVVCLSLPSLVLALTLLVVASRTGWFPVGGMPPADASAFQYGRHLALPVLALSLPVAAVLERLQSRAIGEARAERCILAAAARGVPSTRLLWRHAWRLSLKPVLAIYGIVIGSLIGGSFAVEYVMAWPGLGALMYEALVARDAHLVAGCAAAGAAALAVGIFAADIALGVVDPRSTEA